MRSEQSRMLAGGRRNRLGGWRAVARAAAAFSLSLLAPAGLRAEYVQTLTDTGNATTNGTNLQAAIDAARDRAGETRIVLPSGATFSKSGSAFTLRNKTIDNAYCTIESSALSSLPAGQRVGPGNAGSMPNLLTIGSNLPVFKTVASAHHYRLRGLEISSTTNATFTSFMELGDSSSAQDTIAKVPHHIDVDRCYVHAYDSTQDLRRCVAINSGLTTITNSYLSGAKSGADAQALQGTNGTGPYFIINNYLEGAAENFMMGGGGAVIPNVLPSDIHFKRNYCYKPMTWRGAGWAVKNLFEIKFGRRFDVQGNLFENTWAGGQEFAIVIKVDGQGSSYNTNADTVTEDVLFRENKIRHAPSGVALQGRDWAAGWTPTMDRVTIVNNTFEDISRATYGATSGWGGSVCHMSNGTKHVTFEHNTTFQDRYVLVVESASWPNSNVLYRNNISNWGTTYGGVRNESQNGTVGLDISAPGAIFQKNVMLNGISSWFTSANHTPNWFPTSWSGVLVNQSGGDYHVVTGSVYDNGGTDGKDVGADVDLVNTATAGCASGSWSGKEIVLYAAEAPTRVGNWAVEADTTAANGQKIRNPDAGLAKVTTPAANPSDYFEITFNAQAGVPYRLWMRMKADADYWGNDSVWAQFNNSVDATGAAIYRIGTTSGTSVSLEEYTNQGEHDWGWQDNGWGPIPTLGPVIYFATSGTQTLRVQRREDGIAIDQIVLSPSTYMGGGPALSAPGLQRDDTTILAKQ